MQPQQDMKLTIRCNQRHSVLGGTVSAVSSQGEILAQLSNDKEENIVYDIDLQRSETACRMWPFFRDRIDSFEDLTKRWRDR